MEMKQFQTDFRKNIGVYTKPRIPGMSYACIDPIYSPNIHIHFLYF